MDLRGNVTLQDGPDKATAWRLYLAGFEAGWEDRAEDGERARARGVAQATGVPGPGW